uniref:Uncharacterized protein n=1 Tax=Megaselia scalaris TaxID=36166 RepID=T1GF03_MEGSC
MLPNYGRQWLQTYYRIVYDSNPNSWLPDWQSFKNIYHITLITVPWINFIIVFFKCSLFPQNF